MHSRHYIYVIAVLIIILIIILAVSFIDGGWYSNADLVSKCQITFKNTKNSTAYAVIYNLKQKSLIDFFTVESKSSVRTKIIKGQPIFVLFSVGPQHPPPHTVTIDSFTPGPEGVVVKL